MSLAGYEDGGGISMGPITLASIIPSTPISDNIWFADGYGTWFGTGDGTTQPDATWTWDDANQWMQLAIPGAGGTGLAEFRYRGDFSRDGAADTFYLNQMLPGVLTISAGATQTSAALFAFSNTQVVNTPTVTDLYTLYVEAPTASGTATRKMALGLGGQIQCAVADGINFTPVTLGTDTCIIYGSNTAGIPQLKIYGPNGSGGGSFTLNAVQTYSFSHIAMQADKAIGWVAAAAATNAALSSGIYWNTAQTNDGLTWGLAAANPLLSIVGQANIAGDYAAAVPTNPTLAIYSATAAATATDEWISLSHNVTDGVITVGSGNVLIAGTSGLAIGATANLYLDGGGDTYITEGTANEIHFYCGGTYTAKFTGASLFSLVGGFAAAAAGGTATDPLFTFINDYNTGIYRVAADSMGLTAGGVLGITVAEVGSAPYLGFFGGGAVAQPTVSGAKVDAVAASIVTALTALGLIIDGTT